MMFPKLHFSLFAILVSLTQVIFAQDIKINEILSDNLTGIVDAYGENSDWIEIHNTTDAAIDLEGYYLSDKRDNPLKWVFPHILIAPQGYLVIYASEEDNVGNELHANFKLDMDGEYVLISDPSGNLVDQLDSIPMRSDVSYGRKPNGSDILKYFNLPTPGMFNSTVGYNGFVDDPNISLPGGYYENPIDVIITHNDIDVVVRYSLDGSEPTANSSIYYNEFHFDDASNNPNVVSMIPTNPSFDYPKPGYDEGRADTRGWLEPYTTINKTNVLKIRAYKTNYLPSHILTSAYFVNSQISDRYSFPVVSITTDMDGFFSDETGIYVYGTTGEFGNYKEDGDEWERENNFQLFENDGSFAIEQTLGTRIHGGGGRHSTLKNLRMYARSEYGKSKFDYKWFDNYDAKEFKRFMVRGPGHRPDCVPRDDLADLLLENLDMDIQHIRHVIVFLNGEYWGIHTIKERFDVRYLEGKYGKKDEDYVILKNTGTLHSGEPEDVEVYYDLLDFVNNNDMSQVENYDFVKDQVDMDNYITYFTTEVFLGNADWVISNVKFWRYKGFDKKIRQKSGLDGKWRWFLFDFDLTFGSSCNSVGYTTNVLDNAFDEDYGRATELARGLKQNEQFVFDFTNRMCDLWNSSFNEDNMGNKVTEIDDLMRPEMQEHVERWRYPAISETLEERQDEIPTLEKWNEIIDGLHTFKLNRKRKVIGHMQDEFDLDDTISIILDVNDIKMGNIQISTILVSEALDGVSENVYPWHGTYFEDNPFPLMAIPKLGYRFVEWEESGETQDTLLIDLDEGASFTAIFEVDPDFIFDDALYINEFMASNNTTIEDEYGAHADWIEIYNPNNKPIDLASFFISDDAEDTYKYQFPRGSNNTIIPALGYKLIWADGRPERGELHTNFKLSASGEDIVLFAPDSSLIDELSFSSQLEDVSFGREKDGDDTWVFFSGQYGPTPNATNNNSAVDHIHYSNVTIYPNPVAQGNSVYFSDRMNIEIYNSLGQMVYKKEQVLNIQTTSFYPGVYIIKTDKNGILKLIVK